MLARTFCHEATQRIQKNLKELSIGRTAVGFLLLCFLCVWSVLFALSIMSRAGRVIDLEPTCACVPQGLLLSAVV